jgi:hypothetical protein
MPIEDTLALTPLNPPEMKDRVVAALARFRTTQVIVVPTGSATDPVFVILTSS